MAESITGARGNSADSVVAMDKELRLPSPAHLDVRSQHHRLAMHSSMSSTATLCGSFARSGPSTPIFPDSRPSDFRGAVGRFGETYDSSAYKTEKLHELDDIDHMPRWKRQVYRASPVFALVAVGAYWLYFAHRIKYTLDAQRVAHKTFYMAWAFIAVEIGVSFPMFLHQSWSCLAAKDRNRPKLRLQGEVVPTVDVFVTCCGEDTDIVLDTTHAACAIDYPPDRFRVVVLDDGNSSDTRKAIEALQYQYANLYYTARQKKKGVPHHYKAGNLNHGLAYTAALNGGPGEYLAALDADMIPEPHWLRAIMAHLVVDADLALSCPPQLFYNVPVNDPLLQRLDVFVHITEPIKDSLGVAWCTGSGYAIRRCALEGIGNFPTGSLAEDVCCSSMLLGAGWKTAYVHEPLQYGTVPDSYVSHLKQRTRWTIGTVQTAIKLRFCIFGPLVRKMTFLQRLSGFVYTISSLFTIFLAASLFTMPIVLISGGTMVAYANYTQLRWLVRLCFFALVSNRLNEWILYLPAGYRLGQRESGAMMWMSPYHAVTVVRSFFLPSWLGGKTAGFSSTGSIKNDLNERDASRRAPLFRRLKVILLDSGAILHVLYILFCIAAVILSTVRAFTQSKTPRELWISLLTHAAWPPILWLLCLVACCVPVHYALCPPTMPDHEELLDRDTATGIAYPKQSAKAPRWTKRNFLHELQYSILTAFTAVIFFGSWFI